MKSFDTSLLILETTSLTTGLGAHEEIAKFGDVKILEASVVGEGRFLVIAAGPSVALEAGLKAAHAFLLGEEFVDQQFFKSIDRAVLESIHSLSQTRLDGSLFVVETETVSGAVELAQSSVAHHGLAPIEIKIRRSGRGAHAYLTGPADKCALAAEECRALLKRSARKGNVTTFEKPSAALQSLFDFV